MEGEAEGEWVVSARKKSKKQKSNTLPQPVVNEDQRGEWDVVWPQEAFVLLSGVIFVTWREILRGVSNQTRPEHSIFI